MPRTSKGGSNDVVSPAASVDASEETAPAEGSTSWVSPLNA
jgi:hypothetical protein